MRLKLLLLFLLLFRTASAIHPNFAYRGELVTTISNGMITVSCGVTGFYDFWLQKGNVVIQSSNVYYYVHTPYLGFADSVAVTFNIPPYVPAGQYTYNFDNGYYVSQQPFTIYENRLSGHVFFDANQNGVFDSGEPGLANHIVRTLPWQNTLITDTSGKYEAFINNGTFNISVDIPAGYTLTTGQSTYSYTFPPDQITGTDFGLYTPPSTSPSHNLNVNNEHFVHNQISNSYWQITGTSNNNQSGVLTIITDSSLSFISSTITPGITTGNILKWNYSLTPFHSIFNTFSLQADSLADTAEIVAIDSVYDDNGIFSHIIQDSIHFNITDEIFTAKKLVNPTGDTTEVHHFTYMYDTLDYKIFMSNTNSTTIDTIQVYDTLSYFFDPDQFHMVFSSFPAQVQLEGNNRLRVYSDSISLTPALVDEANSHAMIEYKCIAGIGTPESVQVVNRANIFMGSYPQQLTNSTLNTLVTQIPNSIPRVENGFGFTCQNPVSGTVVINTSVQDKFLLEIFSLDGKKIFSEEAENDILFDSEMLQNGVYIFKTHFLKTGNSEFRKMVVQN